jgi:phosphatidylglycerophosphate synthase
MEYIIQQALSSIGAIPVGIWIVLLLYSMSMFYVYLFGLPFKQIDRRTYTEKDVSHGIVSTLQRVRVYNAWYTEANAITALGALGLIGMIYMSITETGVAAIPILFIIAAVHSDMLDGKACARWNCHSHIGAIIDPLRDRLAAIAVVITLTASLGTSIYWVVPIMVVILFELGVGAIAASARKFGKTLNSHGAGEQRQVAHLLAIETVLISVYWLKLSAQPLNITVAVATSIMALASIIAFVNYKRLHHENY